MSVRPQFAVLVHPPRQRFLFALGHRPAAISGPAFQLDARKGNVAHHLNVLREAGPVYVVERRQVRGGYRAVLPADGPQDADR